MAVTTLLFVTTLMVLSTLHGVADARLRPRYPRRPTNTTTASLSVQETSSPSRSSPETGSFSVSVSDSHSLFSSSPSDTQARTGSRSASRSGVSESGTASWDLTGSRSLSVSLSVSCNFTASPPPTRTPTRSKSSEVTASGTPSLTVTAKPTHSRSLLDTHSPSVQPTLTKTITPPPTPTSTHMPTSTLTSITIPPTPTRTHLPTVTPSGTAARTTTLSLRDTTSRSDTLSHTTDTTPTASSSATVTTTTSLGVSGTKGSATYSSSGVASSSHGASVTESLIAVNCAAARVTLLPRNPVTDADIRAGGVVVVLTLPPPAVWSLQESAREVNVTSTPVRRTWSSTVGGVEGTEQRFGFAATLLPVMLMTRPAGIASLITFNGATMTLTLPPAPKYSISVEEELTVTAQTPLCVPHQVTASFTIAPTVTSFLGTAAYTGVLGSASGLSAAAGVAGVATGMAPDFFAVADVQTLAAIATAGCAPAVWVTGAGQVRVVLDPIGALTSAIGGGATASSTDAELRFRAAVVVGAYFAVCVVTAACHYVAVLVVHFVLRGREKRRQLMDTHVSDGDGEEVTAGSPVAGAVETPPVPALRSVPRTNAAAAADGVPLLQLPLLDSGTGDRLAPSPNAAPKSTNAEVSAPPVLEVPQAASRRLWLEALSATRFPSASLLVALLLLPGAVASTVPQLVLLTSTPALLSTQFGYLFFFCFAMVVEVGVLILIPACNRRANVKWQRFTFMVTRPALVKIALPMGTWVPKQHVHSLGVCFASARLYRRQGHALPYAVNALAVGLASVPSWTSSSACVGLYSGLSAVFVLLGAVTTLARWPYAARLSSVLAVVCYMLLGVKSVVGALHATSSDDMDSAATSIGPVVDVLLLVAVVLRGLHATCVGVFLAFLAPRWAADFTAQKAAEKRLRKEQRDGVRKRRHDARSRGADGGALGEGTDDALNFSAREMSPRDARDRGDDIFLLHDADVSAQPPTLDQPTTSRERVDNADVMGSATANPITVLPSTRRDATELLMSNAGQQPMMTGPIELPVRKVQISFAELFADTTHDESASATIRVGSSSPPASPAVVVVTSTGRDDTWGGETALATDVVRAAEGGPRKRPHDRYRTVTDPPQLQHHIYGHGVAPRGKSHEEQLAEDKAALKGYVSNAFLWGDDRSDSEPAPESSQLPQGDANARRFWQRPRPPPDASASAGAARRLPDSDYDSERTAGTE